MKFFSTDGIRGKVEEILESKIISKIASFLSTKTSKVIIGYDTRISSLILLDELTDKLNSLNVDVYNVGVCPTPLIPYYLKVKDFNYGLMITASHNPFFENGIKLFNKEGKITKLEANEILTSKVISKKTNKGRLFSINNDEYINYINSIIDFINDKRIVVDASNGSTTSFINKLSLDQIDVINDKPNGVNINNNCGSLHSERLQKYVKDNNYDYGFSFDGDGDRIILVDQNRIYDGDDLLYFLAKELDLKEVVHTKLTNRGIISKLNNEGVSTFEVNVGDSNVLSLMKEKRIKLGVEPSGHLIFEENMTSDSLYSLIKILKFINKKNIYTCDKYHSYSINYPQMNNSKKSKIQSLLDSNLSKDDYYLLRESGTEDLVRLNVQIKEYSLFLKVIKLLERENLCAE